MKNPVEYARAEVAEIIKKAYAAASSKGALPEAEVREPSVEAPKDIKNGDFSSSFAMQNTKALKTPPRAVADALIANMDLSDTCFESCEAAGPGFMNFRLSHRWFEDVLREIESAGEDYGKTQTERPEKIMVEFVSANPTGPMHLGNARGGVLGDCLAEVLSRAGNDVSREFYVNDAGNQIEKFALSIDTRFMQMTDGGEEKHPFPEDGYHGDDIKDIARGYIEKYGDGLKGAPQRERMDKLSQYGLSVNLPRMKKDLEKYKIFYDRWFLESELHKSGYVKDTMEKLKATGYTYEKDGALWLATSRVLTEKYKKEGKSDEEIEKLELKDDVLCRSNGFYTYFAVDIAYHRNKFEERGFDRVINIWGADHHGHVARLKAALDVLGLDGEHKLEIVLMQLVRLTRDGEVVRMSKRTGKAISLSDLLDEISVDAARYFFNSRASDTHLEFDLGLAVRTDSENPVYYVQYAHARINSILRALSAEGVKTDGKADYSLLCEESETELIRELSKLPEEIKLAAESREPSRLNHYAASVATAFHRFYTECRIKDIEDKELQAARIGLIKAAALVIKNTLGALGVSAPDRM
ncbi:MAG: arginine--tRNA ligase [Clostridia bacterium]|nr:arginine--tRNA ligase [Clostridia bacterium]